MKRINSECLSFFKKLIIIFILYVCLVSASSKDLYLDFNQAKINIHNIDGFTIIDYPDGITIGKPGTPLLPTIPVRVVAPSNAQDVQINIIDQNWISLPGTYNPYPVQPARPIGEDIAFIPPDKNIYTSKKPFPLSLIIDQDIGNCGGFKIATILICPFKYQPDSRQLFFCTDLHLQLNYTTSTRIATCTKTQNKIFTNLIKKLVINQPEVAQYAPMQKTGLTASPFLPPGDYKEVYITSPELVPYFQDIIFWRTKSGIPCTTMTVNEIAATYPGWDAPEKIRNFIKDADSTWGTIYFTLAGDTGQVPTRILVNQLGANVSTDLYFSDLDSTWDADGDHIYAEEEDSAACDWYSDVFVGRLATTTPADVENFKWKIFTYEKTPASGYLKKCLLPAAYLWNPYGGDIVNDSIANHTPPGWQDSKLYEMYGNVNHQITLDSINAGFGFVHYAGHGNWNGIYWAEGVDTFVHNLDFPLINNGNRLGVHTSIACFPGAFDMVVDSCLLNGDCLAENLLNCSTGGAVAVIMNSRTGLGTPPTMGPSEKLDLEFYRKVFDDDIYIIGEAHAVSKDVYVPAGDTAAEYLFCILELNLFGDPAMPMWLDEPISLNVDYPDSIPLGSQQLTVTVSDARAPVPNALVCLMSKLGEIYEYEYTNVSGQVIFNISPSLPDTMWVTTSAMNHLPDEGYLIIYDSMGIADQKSKRRKFIFLPPAPSILTEHTHIDFTLPAPAEVCLSLFDISGRNLGTIINGKYPAGHHNIQWDGRVNDYIIPSGVYFIQLVANNWSRMRKIVINR